MKSTGIIRRVDELGRIVLPVELRRAMDIMERDQLEIYLEGDKIVLKKNDPTCVFCGVTQRLSDYRGKQICRECLETLRKV